MSEFRGALDEFRKAIQDEAQQAGVPPWQDLLEHDRAVRMGQLRWATAALVVLLLGAIPLYRNAQARRIAAEQSQADAVLLQQVNEGLSRSVPRAMAPLMNWSPGGGANR